MRGINRQLIASFLSAILLGLPVYGNGGSPLVGVAQGSGAFQINGQASQGQNSIFSGDRIHTDNGSSLTLICNPRERIRFAAGSTAQLSKKQDVTVVGMDLAVVDFQTAGNTRVLVPRDGVEVWSSGASPTLARVEVLASGVDKVTVVQGSLEVRWGKNGRGNSGLCCADYPRGFGSSTGAGRGGSWEAQTPCTAGSGSRDDCSDYRFVVLGRLADRGHQPFEPVEARRTSSSSFDLAHDVAIHCVT